MKHGSYGIVEEKMDQRLHWVWSVTSDLHSNFKAREVFFNYLGGSTWEISYFVFISRAKQIALRNFFSCESVCLFMSIPPKVVEMDPIYGVSLDHKFHEECHMHIFCLSVCLSVWLAGWPLTPRLGLLRSFELFKSAALLLNSHNNFFT